MVVREFWVREGREADFEGIFGPGGIWPDFLKRSRSYLGSQLWLESKTERRFQLRDFWQSHVGFEAFRAIHQLDCHRLEQLIAREQLVAREEFVGAFYVNDPEWGEGDDLVPS
ncbi:MAG: hypothetical protein ACJ71Q_05945 [Terriglobales bacterium]